MADGGFRPAYKVQLTTDVASQVIAGVAVTNRGTDQGEGLAVEEQVVQRTGRHPGACLVDGGFVDLEDIRALERLGVQVCAPPKRRGGTQWVRWKPGTEPEVLAWPERMETE